MKGYLVDIERETLENENFRKVLFTGAHSQLVVMSLLPTEEIGEEVHTHDQFIRLESGEAKVVLDGEETTMKEGDAVVIPAGVRHNITNMLTDAPVKLYTIYSPAEHRDGTVHATKADAMRDHEEHP